MPSELFQELNLRPYGRYQCATDTDSEKGVKYKPETPEDLVICKKRMCGVNYNSAIATKYYMVRGFRETQFNTDVDRFGLDGCEASPPLVRGKNPIEL